MDSDRPEVKRVPLTKIASARTAIMKNLGDPIPRPNVERSSRESFPIGRSRMSEIDGSESKSKSLIVSAKKSRGMNPFSYRPEFQLTFDDEGLFRKISEDKSLSGYEAVMIGQSRRRTAVSDVLIGSLKKLLSWRSDFELVFSLRENDEAEKLSNYFKNCKVFTVPDYAYPVQILYLKQPVTDYIEAAAILAVEIHLTEEPSGDILVFLAGEEEIGLVCGLIIQRLRIIREEGKEIVPEIVVLRGYRENENDPRLLEKKIQERRVIVSTSESEDSFRAKNIRFVIDCGFEKRVSDRNPKLETNSLAVAPISQDWAVKRTVRAGGYGKCYRLYTETSFLEEMGPTNVPEILRMNIGEAVLRAKALGINDLSSFDFVDFPPLDSIVNATRQLYCLGALGEDMSMTSLGRDMVEFPVGPVLSKILVAAASVDFRCSDEVLIIVAMVQTGNMFYSCQDEAGQKRVGFIRPESDHLTLLEVFKAWEESDYSGQWCLDNLVKYESLRRAREFRNQLIATMNRLKLEIISANKDYTAIRKAITAGLFFHAAKWDPQVGCYRTMIDDNQKVHIHSDSAVFREQPNWVVYNDLHVMSDDDKEYMIGVTAIDPNWLRELAPRYFGEAGPTQMMMTQHGKRRRDDPDSTMSLNGSNRAVDFEIFDISVISKVSYGFKFCVNLENKT